MHSCPVLPFTSFTHLCACPRVGGKWSLTLGVAQSELFLCPAAGHPLQSPAEMQNLGPNAALQSTAACRQDPGSLVKYDKHGLKHSNSEEKEGPGFYLLYLSRFSRIPAALTECAQLSFAAIPG